MQLQELYFMSDIV